MILEMCATDANVQPDKLLAESQTLNIQFQYWSSSLAPVQLDDNIHICPNQNAE